ncbi:hypothetical protein PHPALM_29519 [Phytophthora palmivora]|uniref:Serine protease family S33 n=1 Tax=Phytophthora palmivora TaxID=4796 RepID=A0A2P4X7D8_9STRA|nr:hypothetical protein PHPALM_29519 [Phytophthora palmivora]
MQFYRIFSLVAIVAVTTCTSDPAPDGKLNGWHPCSANTISSERNTTDPDAECILYRAPLCYPGICDATKAPIENVDIFVKRLPAVATDPTTASNVWLLQGGPGSPSTGMEYLMIDLHSKLEGAVNVYTMDHRGSGRSTLLKCTGSSNTSKLGDEITLAEVPVCAEELEQKYGDLSSFSITSAATDLEVFITEYSNGANTTVYGVGYGTTLVERLMHLDPPSVTGYVLDSVDTSSGGSKFLYMSEFDTNIGEVADQFLELCSTDEFCNVHFKATSLRSVLEELIIELDKNPKSTCAAMMHTVNNNEPNVSDEPPSFTLRRMLGSLLADSIQRTFIAPVVYRLHRCAPKDAPVLTRFIKGFNWYQNLGFNRPETTWSSVLYYLIVYSEMWEKPTPSTSEMIERFTNVRMSESGDYWMSSHYCAFSKDKTCNDHNVSTYEAHGIIYERDEYWNKSATIPNQASVLLLSGKLNQMTPHKYAIYLLEALQGDKKELVTFDHTADSVLGSSYLDELDDSKGTCGMELLVSFVSNNGNLDRLDKSCLDEMPPFNLTVPIDHLHSYFGTTDAFDGDYNSTL